MPARSNPPSSSIERRRSAKPAGISFHLSHFSLRPSPSRALGSLGLCGVAPFALGDQKAIPSSIHASTPPPPPPSSSIIPWDHHPFPSAAYSHPSRAFHLQCPASDSSMRSWPHSMYVYACLEGSPESKLPPRSTISSGLSPHRVTRNHVRLDVKHRMMYLLNMSLSCLVQRKGRSSSSSLPFLDIRGIPFWCLRIVRAI